MIDNLKLNEIESNNGQAYLNNLIWKQFKINFRAIKSLDDIIIILKASNLSLHFIPG
ncbi:MAG TPA: hypothetical protein PKL04_00520 [Methanofastidiosum sp.]|nr:hypothetical protein [Methanofastidiosum sp.]